MKYTVTVKVEQPKKEGEGGYRSPETLFEFCTEHLDVHSLALEVVRNSSVELAIAMTPVRLEPGMTTR